MYSIFCAAGVIFVIFCVPETKGRELDNMALVFRKSFRVIAGKSRNQPKVPKEEKQNGQRNAAFKTDDDKVVESTKC